MAKLETWYHGLNSVSWAPTTGLEASGYETCTRQITLDELREIAVAADWFLNGVREILKTVEHLDKHGWCNEPKPIAEKAPSRGE